MSLHLTSFFSGPASRLGRFCRVAPLQRVVRHTFRARLRMLTDISLLPRKAEKPGRSGLGKLLDSRPPPRVQLAIESFYLSSRYFDSCQPVVRKILTWRRICQPVGKCGCSPLWTAVAAATALPCPPLSRAGRRVNQLWKAVAAATALQSATRTGGRSANRRTPRVAIPEGFHSPDSPRRPWTADHFWASEKAFRLSPASPLHMTPFHTFVCSLRIVVASRR